MSNKPMRLVLVTDNADQAAVVEQAATTHGWQLLPCVGRPVPYELLDHLRVDLFLIDLDVNNALDQLKEFVRRPGANVIALASAGRIGEWHNAVQLGAREVVSIPIDVQLLTNAVHQLANQTQVMRPVAEPQQQPAFDSSVAKGFPPASPSPMPPPQHPHQASHQQMGPGGVPTAERQPGWNNGANRTASSNPQGYSNGYPAPVHPNGNGHPSFGNPAYPTSVPQPNYPANPPISTYPNGGAPGYPNGTHPNGAYPNGGRSNSAHPNGGHPNGGHPNGAHPNGGHPNGGHPNGAHPNGGHANGNSAYAHPNYPAMPAHPNGTGMIPHPASANGSIIPLPSGYVPATLAQLAGSQPGPQLNGNHAIPTPFTGENRVIAVTGLRGGVGRSTIAANFAVALRTRLRANVILAEAHHDLGHLALMLNLMPRHTLASLANVRSIDLDLLRGVLQNHNTGLQLFSAPLDVAQLVEFSPETWHMMLTLLKQMAQFVVIDTSSHADPVLSEVLTVADDIFVVCGPDIFSLRSTLSMLETLRSQREKVTGRVHVLFNRAGVRGGLDENTLQKQLREKISMSFADDTALATYALNRGVPFVMSHTRSSLTKGINALVDTFEVKGASGVSPAKKPFALLPLLSRN